MSRQQYRTGWRLILTVVLATILWAVPAGPESKSTPYVVLSREFFEAMEKLSRSGAIYGDRTEPLLEQLVLTGKFIVKTNLTLIQQQERIIQQLEFLNRASPAPGVAK